MRRKRCKNRQHHDRRLRGGQHYECTACREVFPCRGCCPHLDCIVATGRELPEHIDPAAREAIAAELALLYPDNGFTLGPLSLTLTPDQAKVFGLGYLPVGEHDLERPNKIGGSS